MENKFYDVLGERRNRERVNRAVHRYLSCVAEAVWHLPQIYPMYELQMQRMSLEKTSEMVVEIQGLRADIKQVFLALIEAVNENKLLLPAPLSAS
jgi:hypothetical protein